MQCVSPHYLVPQGDELVFFPNKRLKGDGRYCDPASPDGLNDRGRQIIAAAMPASCGKCVACRTTRCTEWLVRNLFEFKTHPPGQSAFLTGTIAPEHYERIHNSEQLAPEVQKFLKRFRRKLDRDFAALGLVPPALRFMSSIEYGERTWRVHFHILLYGFDCWRETWIPVRASKSGEQMFSQSDLSALWPLGEITVQPMTARTIGYVTGYALKKQGGSRFSDWPELYLPSGNRLLFTPEKISMSKRPGIGGPFYEKFGGDVYPSDFLVHDGQKYPVPKFFDKRLVAATSSGAASFVKDGVFYKDRGALQPVLDRRVAAANTEQALWNSSAERLAVRIESLILRQTRDRSGGSI